jgi:hypothetical protein
MSTPLLIIIAVVLFAAICALAGFWFIRDAKHREQRHKPVHPVQGKPAARGAAGRYTWDGGIKTSPRQLR